MADQKKPDSKTPLTGISGRESVFDKRLREFRNSGTFEKPQIKANQFLKKQTDFETPSMDSKLRPAVSDSDEITEIERLAFYDEASGLLNTRTTLGKLATEIRRSTRYKRNFSIMIIELDSFFNKSGLTQLAVEMLFTAFCKQLKKNIREVDIIGRFDEPSVLVICPETSLGDAIAEAERLKNIIASTHYKQVGTHIALTISVGVAAYPDNGTSPAEILGGALEAAQEAVSRGGNIVCAAKTIPGKAVQEDFSPVLDLSPAKEESSDMSPPETQSSEMVFPTADVSTIIT